MNRRLTLSTIFAGSAMAMIAPTAGVALAADWCEDDPLIQIKTPNGFMLPVNVTNYALGRHQGALKVVHDNPVPPYITYTVDPIAIKIPKAVTDGVGKDGKAGLLLASRKPGAPLPVPVTNAWEVSIWVLIPGHPIQGDAVEGRFKVKTVASVGENATGKIYARDEGWSDNLLQLRFRIED